MQAIDDEAATSGRRSDGNAAAPAALVVSLSAGNEAEEKMQLYLSVLS